MDMDYSLIIEKAKFLFLLAFISGIFFGWFIAEFNVFCNFICKLICKYLRFRRLKRKNII